MNTDTGEVTRKTPRENEEIMRDLKAAMMDPDAPLPKEIPLTEEQAEKVKHMSRKSRREWAKKVYRALKKKAKLELRAKYEIKEGSQELSLCQQSLREALHSVRDDLMEMIPTWKDQKSGDGPVTLHGITDIEGVEELDIPRMKIEVKVIIGGAEEEEAKE